MGIENGSKKKYVWKMWVGKNIKLQETKYTPALVNDINYFVNHPCDPMSYSQVKNTFCLLQGYIKFPIPPRPQADKVRSPPRVQGRIYRGKWEWELKMAERKNIF